MPLIKTIPIIDGLIFIWQISETPEELLCFFTTEEIEKEEYKKFTFEKRKTEWLATRALLKQVIGNSFKIAYTESGKPLLDHPFYHHISITHSKEFIAVFIHQNKEIGIDIESKNRNYSPILIKYLSDQELCQVMDESSVPCLYWCAKEALFKMVEEQGIDFKKQFEIQSVDPSREMIIARYISSQQPKTFHLNYLDLIDHYLVWVVDDPVL